MDLGEGLTRTWTLECKAFLLQRYILRMCVKVDRVHKCYRDNFRPIRPHYVPFDNNFSLCILFIIFYYRIICFKFLQSLKKEVEWDRSVDDRSTTGESSTDYRHPHEPVSRCIVLYFLSCPLTSVIVIC